MREDWASLPLVKGTKACPRCGSEARLGRDVAPVIDATIYYVCRSCPCWFWVVRRRALIPGRPKS